MPWEVEEKPTKCRNMSTAPLFAGLLMEKPVPAGLLEMDPVPLDSEDHEYIREHCFKPLGSLKTFSDLVEADKVLSFVEQVQLVSRGAVRAESGFWHGSSERYTSGYRVWRCVAVSFCVSSHRSRMHTSSRRWNSTSLWRRQRGGRRSTSHVSFPQPPPTHRGCRLLATISMSHSRSSQATTTTRWLKSYTTGTRSTVGGVCEGCAAEGRRNMLVLKKIDLDLKH